jgi:hypothetical protein
MASAAADFWLIQLPTGRVVRSRSTAHLRQHVRKGRVPPGSRVRRRAGDGWRTIEEVIELAGALPRPNGLQAPAAAATPAPAAKKSAPATPRPAPKPRTPRDFSAWRTLGVRGLMRELFDALDSSLHRAKLALACLLGVLGAVVVIAWDLLDVTLEGWNRVAVGASLAVAGLLAGSLIVTLITQITFVELSRLRQPHRTDLWPDALAGAVRLAAALVVVVGAGLTVILGLRALPDWMLTQAVEGEAWWRYGAAAVLILRLVLEVLFWPILALAPLLLSPILVVEECGAIRGLGEWWGMLRRHLGRIFLYEALAAAMGIVFTAPLALPILLASGSLDGLPDLHVAVGRATLTVLSGIALTPLLAYLLVANVFIYLNLRYEFFHSAR